MADIQNRDSEVTEPDPATAGPTDQECKVLESWSQVIQGVLGILLLIGALTLVFHYGPMAVQSAPPDDVQKQIHDLSAQVEQLKQEQAMPAVVLNRYRNSIGYINGIYQVGFPNQRAEIRARVSGTGFLIAGGLVATNRHVAQPWYGDSEAQKLIDRGAIPTIENLVIFFPGSPTPVSLLPGSTSKTSDLAVLRVEDAQAVRSLPPLPLADSAGSPGQLVTVIGYPMGIAGMVAKSPSGIYERLAYRRNDISAASELAALSLIRPSTTCGHLGDVVGDKLIYDAPTAHGGSGGPVFNVKGEVIGVNSAYMDGFTGGTLGVSVDSLRPLLQEAQQR